MSQSNPAEAQLSKEIITRSIYYWQRMLPGMYTEYVVDGVDDEWRQYNASRARVFRTLLEDAEVQVGFIFWNEGFGASVEFVYEEPTNDNLVKNNTKKVIANDVMFSGERIDFHQEVRNFPKVEDDDSFSRHHRGATIDDIARVNAILENIDQGNINAVNNPASTVLDVYGPGAGEIWEHRSDNA